jgi:hypothetical protein
MPPPDYRKINEHWVDWLHNTPTNWRGTEKSKPPEPEEQNEKDKATPEEPEQPSKSEK